MVLNKGIVVKRIVVYEGARRQKPSIFYWLAKRGNFLANPTKLSSPH
jgi:hypothetical protein